MGRGSRFKTQAGTNRRSFPSRPLSTQHLTKSGSHKESTQTQQSILTNPLHRPPHRHATILPPSSRIQNQKPATISRSGPMQCNTHTHLDTPSNPSCTTLPIRRLSLSRLPIQGPSQNRVQCTKDPAVVASVRSIDEINPPNQVVGVSVTPSPSPAGPNTTSSERSTAHGGQTLTTLKKHGSIARPPKRTLAERPRSGAAAGLGLCVGA